MRIASLSVLATLLAVGMVPGQASVPAASLPGAPEPPPVDAPAPVADVPSMPPPSSASHNYPHGRLLSRWLARSRSAREAPDATEGGSEPRPSAGSAPTDSATPTTTGASTNPAKTAARPNEDRAADQRRGSEPITSNPAAVDIITGTGALGRLLGLDEKSGVRLGGRWIGDGSGVLSGGRVPGAWAPNSLTIVDLNLDTDKLFGWSGGSFGTEFLQYSGRPTNGLAGAFPGFNSLEVTPPLTRQELYELWYRQALFDNKLIFRIGKSVPTYDFNNVVRPVPVSDPAAAIPAVTGLIYTPVFVNPTLLGVIPSYYNSATGITATLAPREWLYLNYGFYDGNLALGRQTGLEGPHFNGHYFHIGEIGASYRVGPERKPGNFGVGVWGQTGMLKTYMGGESNGASGVYLFEAQRLWFRRPGIDNSGVSGFYQFGANNSNALPARDYVGGGLTAFGLVPGRPDDSFGFGINCTWLTQGDLAADVFYGDAPFSKPLPPVRSSQLMLQWYYQMKLVNGWFFQTSLTEIPTPGERGSIPNALALTFRLTVLC
jgi:porin